MGSTFIPGVGWTVEPDVVDERKDLPRLTGAQIDAINARIAAGSKEFPTGTKVVRTDDQVVMTVEGVGTEARFVSLEADVANAVKKSELAAPTGAGEVGYGDITVEQKLAQQISVSDYLLLSPPTNHSAGFQAAINAASAAGIPLTVNANGDPNRIYYVDGVDVPGGMDIRFEDGVLMGNPPGATGYAFQTLGTSGARVTKRVRLYNARHDGGGMQWGLFRAAYADYPRVEDCSGTGYPMTAMNDGCPVQLTECLRPFVRGGLLEGGRVGLLFMSCTGPTALQVSTNAQGRDGILVYTNPSGTTSTDALLDGCRTTNWAMNGEAGRAGQHGYGVRRITIRGGFARGDSGQTFDDTAGYRFRDCEDFYTDGYNASSCMTGVLVNEIGDYSGAPHNIVTRGAIGPGTVSNVFKFGVIVAGVKIVCDISGPTVTNVSAVASAAGISHSGIGSITGATVADMACVGINTAGDVTVGSCMFRRAGNGSLGLPSLRLGGVSTASGCAFSDERGTPVATLAIRALSGSTSTIGTMNYGVGVTDFVQADAGSTIKKSSSPIRQKFNGVPSSFAGTVEDGVQAISPSGILYTREGGAWAVAAPKSLGLQTVNATPTSILHGLGYTPTRVAWAATSNINIWQSAVADTTTIYLTASVAGAARITVQ